MSLIEDFIGTFVETLMLLILMNLFSREYFKNKIRLIISITLISVGVALLDILETPFTTILNYVIIVAILRVLIKRHVFSMLFEVIFASSIIMLIEYVLAVLFYKMQGIESLGFSNRCIQLLVALAICIALKENHKLQVKIQNVYEKYQREIYFIAVTLFSFCGIELYLWKVSEESVFDQSSIILVYTVVWLCLSLYLFKKLIENRRQRGNILLHEQYMETTENLLDSLYSDKHDFNKHLQAIEGLCQCEKEKQAVEEIEKYIESLKIKESKKKKSSVSINTGNGVVNALLYSKIKEAEKHEIQLFYIPNGKFPEFSCEQYELVQIVGNLLDNAFEYVCGLEKEQRKVILSINEDEDKKYIEVRNTYCAEKNEKVSISQNKSCSTKQGERRGYGLQNIKSITLKYNGKFNIFQEENEFIVEILF